MLLQSPGLRLGPPRVPPCPRWPRCRLPRGKSRHCSLPRVSRERRGQSETDRGALGTRVSAAAPGSASHAGRGARASAGSEVCACPRAGAGAGSPGKVVGSSLGPLCRRHRPAPALPRCRPRSKPKSRSHQERSRPDADGTFAVDVGLRRTRRPRRRGGQSRGAGDSETKRAKLPRKNATSSLRGRNSQAPRADRGLGVAGGGTECAKVTGRRARPRSGRIWKAAFASFVERGSSARPACPSLARRGRFFLNYNRGLCKSDLHCK